MTGIETLIAAGFNVAQHCFMADAIIGTMVLTFLGQAAIANTPLIFGVTIAQVVGSIILTAPVTRGMDIRLGGEERDDHKLRDEA